MKGVSRLLVLLRGGMSLVLRSCRGYPFEVACFKSRVRFEKKSIVIELFGQFFHFAQPITTLFLTPFIESYHNGRRYPQPGTANLEGNHTFLLIPPGQSTKVPSRTHRPSPSRRKTDWNPVRIRRRHFPKLGQSRKRSPKHYSAKLSNKDHKGGNDE